MTQTPILAGPSFFTSQNLELPREPRLLFVRASLEIAQLQDRELRRLAISPDPADSQQAVAIFQSEAIAAPEKVIIQSRWDHPDASYWLLHAKADSRAFIYSDEDLCVATVYCAAELQVSRDIKLPDLELNVLGLAPSANKLIAGWRQERQHVLVRFLANAAKRNGATYSRNGVSRRAWGLDPQASLGNISRAIRDLSEFPSHLTSRSLGNRSLARGHDGYPDRNKLRADPPLPFRFCASYARPL